MDVVGLHGEMHDAEPFARGAGEPAPQDRESRLPERGQLGADPQRDVHWIRLSVRRPTAMRNRGATPRRPARAGTPPAPASPLEKIELLGGVTAGFPRLYFHNE